MTEDETAADGPRLIAVDEQRAAVMRIVVPRAQMPAAMPAAINELKAVLRAQGVVASGPLFAHHLRTNADVFDLEVGFPIERPIDAVGRVLSGGLPAATVVKMTYRGSYEGLHAAWGDVWRWMAEHGHPPASHLWEVYVRGPETSANPSDWRTDLYQPLGS